MTGKTTDQPGWSDALREQTRGAVEDMDFMPLTDEVAFKNFDGRFGTISVGNVLAGRLAIVDRRTGETSLFPDAEALLAAGWAID